MRQITTILIVLVFVAVLIASGMYMGAPRSQRDPSIAPPGYANAAQSAIMTGDFARGNYSLVYVVDGMHCSGCADAIKAEVKEVAGVRAVECTFESKRATIALDTPDLRPAVEHAITKLGYKIALQPAPVSETDAASSK